MAADNKNKTLYEILGLGQGARGTDIEFAYKKLRSQMQREDMPPDPKGAALAKFAYDTLRDPARRAQYDASLDKIAPPPVAKRRKRRKTPWGAIAGVAIVAAIAIGAFLYMGARQEKGAVIAAPTPQQILEDASSLVGRVQGTIMSGEVRVAGAAIVTGRGEMVTTCHALPTGAQLSIRIAGAEERAEVVRANEDLDICTLGVRQATRDPIKLRTRQPAAGEKVLAIEFDGALATARPVTIGQVIDDPKGPAMRIEAPGPPLANGTPIVDGQGRLVGIVTAPHAHGEGLNVALGAGRIADSRNVVAAAPAQAAAASTSAAPAIPRDSSRGPHGRKVDEGFMSDYEADEEGRVVRPLDNLTVGRMGAPVIYWTKWTGRETGRPRTLRCVITNDSEAEPAFDGGNTFDNTKSDGFWNCGFSPLRGFPEGTYTFTIIVDGDQIAESSIRIERRFIDGFRLSPWKVALGLLAGAVLLFGWLRKKRSGE